MLWIKANHIWTCKLWFSAWAKHVVSRFMYRKYFLFIPFYIQMLLEILFDSMALVKAAPSPVPSQLRHPDFHRTDWIIYNLWELSHPCSAHNLWNYCLENEKCWQTGNVLIKLGTNEQLFSWVSMENAKKSKQMVLFWGQRMKIMWKIMYARI